MFTEKYYPNQDFLPSILFTQMRLNACVSNAFRMRFNKIALDAFKTRNVLEIYSNAFQMYFKQECP